MRTAFIVLLFVSFALVYYRAQINESANNRTVQNTNRNVNEKNISHESEPLPKIVNPHLIIKKSRRILELFDGDKLIKTYKMALGFASVGDKEKEGDGKTPEGDFYVFTKNDRSKFYLSLGVSYPSIEDAERGLKTKLISKNGYDQIVQAIKDKKMPPQNTRLGGEIYIHGGGNSKDWTWGCVALENEEIKEIFDAISVGTPVKIEA